MILILVAVLVSVFAAVSDRGAHRLIVIIERVRVVIEARYAAGSRIAILLTLCLLEEITGIVAILLGQVLLYD